MGKKSNRKIAIRALTVLNKQLLEFAALNLKELNLRGVAHLARIGNQLESTIRAFEADEAENLRFTKVKKETVKTKDIDSALKDIINDIEEAIVKGAK